MSGQASGWKHDSRLCVVHFSRKTRVVRLALCTFHTARSLAPESGAHSILFVCDLGVCAVEGGVGGAVRCGVVRCLAPKSGAYFLLIVGGLGALKNISVGPGFGLETRLSPMRGAFSK